MSCPQDLADGREQLELSKKIFELSTVIEVSKEFISTFDPQRINSKIVFTMMGVVGAKRGALYYFTDGRRRLRLHKSVNFPQDSLPPSLELDAGQASLLDRLSRPAFLGRLEGPGYGFLGCLRAGCVADPLLIPLLAENELLGLIVLAEKLNADYDDEDRAMLSSLANFSALALQKKNMVEMLIKSEKMAELGRLGSGIVHEIKNPLTSIIMISEMLLAGGERDPKSMRYYTVINQEAQRILRLSQNILSLARPRKPEMKRVDLNRIVEETLSLVEYELKKNKVELALGLGEGGVFPRGDEEKLRQVLLNLLINAVHAMDNGGRLEVTTGLLRDAQVGVPEGYSRHVLGDPPALPAAVITISDEGSGMAPGILDKIFEPFFTTKAEGLGTGLGLYVTRNIVLEHRGRLVVSSCPGRGTSFSIALPLAAVEAETKAEG